MLDWITGVSEFTILIETDTDPDILNKGDGDALSDKRCSAVLEISGVWENVSNEEAELEGAAELEGSYEILTTVELDTDGTRLDVSRGLAEGSKENDAYELWDIDGSGDDVYVLETLELSDA